MIEVQKVSLSGYHEIKVRTCESPNLYFFILKQKMSGIQGAVEI